MENQLVPLEADTAPLAPLSTGNIPWRTVLKAYLQTLDSPRTKHAYRRAIESAMLQFGELYTVTPLELTAYRDRWMDRLDEDHARHLSTASVAQHLAAVRAFLLFAQQNQLTLLTRDLIKLTLKSPRVDVIRPYQILNQAELRRLLSSARDNPRDRMLLALAAATGLREMEICNLRVGDITSDDAVDLILRVRKGKGMKDRLVPLDRDTAALLRSYFAWRKITLTGKTDALHYVFASRKGKGAGRLSTARLRQLIAYYAARAGIEKRISFHSLRHTAAVNWIRDGAPITGVQKLLGHARLDTTQRYADHFLMDELKVIVNAKNRERVNLR